MLKVRWTLRFFVSAHNMLSFLLYALSNVGASWMLIGRNQYGEAVKCVNGVRLLGDAERVELQFIKFYLYTHCFIVL
jgi:hypothetical protein